MFYEEMAAREFTSSRIIDLVTRTPSGFPRELIQNP
jgi:hypothetical protein